MKIIEKEDKNYPKKLLKIKNPPQKIYIEGNKNLLNKEIIAIVGSRMATEYGKKCAKLFASELSKQGFTIISGLAVGIDTIAHIYSMEEVGKTIAVLGSGFNNIYPEENYYLYKKILENNGCVITEYPPETQKSKENFPKRNRIISGLSVGVLLVEARYGSGGAITAKHALKQGKNLFCIPNRIDEKTGYNTNLLIKQGANLVTCPQDIVDVYMENIEENQKLTQKIEKNKEKNTQKAEEEQQQQNQHKNQKLKQQQNQQLNQEQNTIKYQEIYKYIGELPISMNELIKLTKKPITEISEALCILEIEGLIKNLPGNKYIRIMKKFSIN